MFRWNQFMFRSKISSTQPHRCNIARTHTCSCVCVCLCAYTCTWYQTHYRATSDQYCLASFFYTHEYDFIRAITILSGNVSILCICRCIMTCRSDNKYPSCVNYCKTISNDTYLWLVGIHGSCILCVWGWNVRIRRECVRCILGEYWAYWLNQCLCLSIVFTKIWWPTFSLTRRSRCYFLSIACEKRQSDRPYHSG